MAKVRDTKPPFAWPDRLDSPDRYPSDWTPLHRGMQWHLDRCKYAAAADRKDVAYEELLRGTPSLRRSQP